MQELLDMDMLLVVIRLDPTELNTHLKQKIKNLYHAGQINANNMDTWEAAAQGWWQV